jgi:hypothetical protein
VLAVVTVFHLHKALVGAATQGLEVNVTMEVAGKASPKAVGLVRPSIRYRSALRSKCCCAQLPILNHDPLPLSHIRDNKVLN